MSLEEKRRKTLEALILRKVEGKKMKDFASKKQNIEERKNKDGKKMSEVKGTRTSKICGEAKGKRENCIGIPARKELFDEKINSTKLNEMINNSIKEAVQTIVRQCSMKEEKMPTLPQSKESEKKRREYQSSIVEDYQKKSLNVNKNRQKSYHIPWQYNNLPTCSKFQPYIKTRRNTTLLPVENEVHNDKKDKKHSKPANNMNTDNRKITGNINIYICSEANDNSQMKDKQEIKSQSCTDTSSTTIIEQSKCVTASSTSSCKLINSIEEKQKKSQLSNSFHEKRDSVSAKSDNSIVCDNEILCKTCGIEPSQFSKKQTDTKAIDKDVRCENTVSLTRDGCCCKTTSTNSTDFRQNSLDSMVPCSRLSICNNSRLSQSWTTIYPSENMIKLHDSSGVLSRAICIKRDQNNVWRNNNEDTKCDATDSNSLLSRLIYTDCQAYSKVSKICFTGDCKYNKHRNEKLQNSISMHNGTCQEQMGYKLLRQSPRCSREHVARYWSACSCIAEEEQDYCINNADKVEKKLSGNICNDVKQSGEMSVCRAAPYKFVKSAAVNEMTFDNAREHSEKPQTYNRTFEDSTEYSKHAAICRAIFENSKESPKATGVPKKFVAEESTKDITVCKTIFTDPKESLKGVTVCETVLPDFKEIPKETICKIPNSNSLSQDIAERIPLRDAEDKLVKEKTSNSNINNQNENIGRKVVQFNNKHGDLAPDIIKAQESVKDLKEDKQLEKDVLNNKKGIPPVLTRPIKESRPLSNNIYSTLPRINLYKRANFALLASKMPRNAKETPKAFLEQRKIIQKQLSPLNQSIKNLQQSNKISAVTDYTSNKYHGVNEKIGQEKPKEETNNDVNAKKIDMEDKKASIHYKDSFLYRSLKKLIDIIRRDKRLQSNELETKRSKSVKTIADNNKEYVKPMTYLLTKEKINDKRVYQKAKKRSVETPIINKDNTKNILYDAGSKPIAPVTDFTIPEKDKKIDVPSINETTRLKPKLLRVIEAKRAHSQPTEITIDRKLQEPKVESIPAENNIIKQYIDYAEIPQTFVRTGDAQEVKTEGLIASKIDATELKNVLKKTEEIEISKDLENKIIERHVSYPQKKRSKEGLLEPTADKDKLSTLEGCLCEPIECIKCNDTFKHYPCKDDEFVKQKDRCIYCYLTAHCTGASRQYLKKPLKINEPSNFQSISLSKNIDACNDCCKKREECKCRKGELCFHCFCGSYKKYRCKKCTTQMNYLKKIDDRKYRSPMNCINCCRPKDKCCCAASVLIKCCKIKGGSRCKKAMICLYCDNPRDKCICRRPIGKCSYCDLPSNICNCQGERAYDSDHELIIKQLDGSRTIPVTNWKPNREVRQYFARDVEDLRSNLVEECCCYGMKRQRPEELSYQQLNVFSDVMDELQRKMSESACCTGCKNNPCCCGSKIDQDKRKEEKKVKPYARNFELKKSRSKSTNICRCNSKKYYKNAVQKATINHRVNCVCKLSPCKCRKSIRPNHKRPLAKCYYCKSSPCTCIITR